MLASRLLVIAALSWHSAILASDVPVYSGDPKVRYGRASRVVEPVYPKDALQANEGAVITVTGPVSPAGVMESPQLVATSANAGAFVDALREALPAWRFYTPTDGDCMPSERPISVGVEFAAREGKPHIYLTYAAQAPTPPQWLGHLPARQLPRIRYPGSMIHDGIEAIVYVRTELDSDGSVTDIVTRTYSKTGGGRWSNLEPFAREVKNAMRHWSYPPDASKPRRRVCDTVDFNLVD